MRIGKSLWLIVLVGLVVCTTGVFAEETITLRWQSVHHSEPQIMDLRDRLISEFEALNPGIKVEKVIVPRADDWTRFVTAAQAHRAPDIYDIGFQNLAQAVAQGWLYPLDEFITPQHEETILDSHREWITVDGKMYAWPFWAGAYATFYNTRMLREAGLDESNLPETWNEYIEWTKKLTKDTNGDGLIDQYGMGDVLGSTNTNWNHHMMFIWTHGGDLLNDDMTECLLDSPEAIEALRLRAELSTVHGVRPIGPTGYEYVEMTNAFAFERVASMISAQWAMAKIEIDNPAIAGQYVVGPIPKGVRGSTFTSLNSQTIGRDSQHPEAAWKFIEFMGSQENQVQRGLQAGWIPVRIDALEDERIKNHPIGPFADLMAVGGSLPAHPAVPEITNIGISMIHDVLLGNKTAEVAASDATRRINLLLNEQ